MPLPWRRAPSTVAAAAATLAHSSSWAGFHTSRESVPAPLIWDKEKTVGGASTAARAVSSYDDGFHAPRDSVPLPPSSDQEKTIGGASTAAPAISLSDDFFKADATGPYASPGWSDLPSDLLIHILNLMELPEALAFRAVCPSWRSASMAAATTVQARRMPWLVYLAAEPLPRTKQNRKLWEPTVSSKFSSLVDEKTFKVSFPRGKAVACCGASHGWLVVANELSDLVLYNPFTAALVPLPSITMFPLGIEGVYGDEGNVVGYRYDSDRNTMYNDRVYDVHSLGIHVYDKVVMSNSPSLGGIALAIHLDGKRLSFARVGDSNWRHVSVIRGINDSVADCVYHHGRFFVLTMEGLLKSWDLSGLHGPKKKTIIAEDDGEFFDVITRYLVSTPWGHLLQVRVILDTDQENCVKVEIDRCDLKSRKMVALTPSKALRGLALFLGQNSPGLLPINKFPELRPNCIYFTTPRLRNDNTFMCHYNQWSGVKVYDLSKKTLEPAFPSGGGNYGTIYPSEIWFTPSL